MSEIKKIAVEELKPGMIFDKAIYVDNENKLVEAKIPVTESDIKKLMMWGVFEIETEGELLNSQEFVKPDSSYIISEKEIVDRYFSLLKKRKKVIEVHSHARKAVEEAYQSIRNVSQFATDDLMESVEDIIKLLNEDSNVFLFLYGLNEGKDYLVAHSVNVTFYSIIMGLALKFPFNKLRDLGLGTLLIDAGMSKIPVYIIHKQSNLTEQEFKQIKTHPLHGYKALRQLGDLNESIANVSLQHHEQFDGKGYPMNLKGKEIGEFSRIATIADSYEAQISSRSYKEKIFFYQAMRNLLSSGVNRFDPEILKIFLSSMSVYPIGSIVELNDSTIGIVIGSIPEKPLRPIIKIIFNKDKKRVEQTLILNLLEKSSLYIVKALGEKQVGINIFDVL